MDTDTHGLKTQLLSVYIRVNPWPKLCFSASVKPAGGNWSLLLALPLGAWAQSEFDPAVFQSPPAKYRGHAMWNFNLGTLNEKDVISGIDEMARLNYGGFFIEPGGRPQPGQGVAFLSDEYFRFYKLAIEEAKKHGLEMILYDDYAFPTGTVGGQCWPIIRSMSPRT